MTISILCNLCTKYTSTVTRYCTWYIYCSPLLVLLVLWVLLVQVPNTHLVTYLFWTDILANQMIPSMSFLCQFLFNASINLNGIHELFHIHFLLSWQTDHKIKIKQLFSYPFVFSLSCWKWDSITSSCPFCYLLAPP